MALTGPANGLGVRHVKDIGNMESYLQISGPLYEVIRAHFDDMVLATQSHDQSEPPLWSIMGKGDFYHYDSTSKRAVGVERIRRDSVPVRLRARRSTTCVK